jgi:hypothetical protein
MQTAAAVDTPPKTLVPTDVTEAKPAVVTVASVTGLNVGDMIFVPVGSTGLPEIEGLPWIIGSIDAGANTFTLLGSDTENSPGTFASTVPLDVYSVVNGLVNLCPDAFSTSPGTAEVIATPTFCDPTASVPGAGAQAGTVEFQGYVDITNPSYAELLKAKDDGRARLFRIEIAQNGYLLFVGTVSTVVLDIPLQGATRWTATVVLASVPRHLF